MGDGADGADEEGVDVQGVAEGGAELVRRGAHSWGDARRCSEMQGGVVASVEREESARGALVAGPLRPCPSSECAASVSASMDEYGCECVWGGALVVEPCRPCPSSVGEMAISTSRLATPLGHATWLKKRNRRVEVGLWRACLRRTRPPTCSGSAPECTWGGPRLEVGRGGRCGWCPHRGVAPLSTSCEEA